MVVLISRISNLRLTLFIDISVVNDRGGFNFTEKSSTANIAKLKLPRIFALLQYIVTG